MAIVAGHVGSTFGIVSALVVSAALALAVTRRWRQTLFLIVSVVGESALFLAASTVVQRNRPQVEYLSPPLPPWRDKRSRSGADTATAFASIQIHVSRDGQLWLAKVHQDKAELQLR